MDPQASTSSSSSVSASQEPRKRKRPTYGLEFDEETQRIQTTFTCRKCGLPKLIRLEDGAKAGLLEKIRTLVPKVTIIAALTSRLLEFHILRIIELNDDPFPSSLNQSFVSTAARLVANASSHSQPAINLRAKDLHAPLVKSLLLFGEQFSEEFKSHHWNESCNIDEYSICLDYFAREYTTAFRNHIFLNFEGRIKKYFHLEADGILTDEEEKDRGRLLQYFLYLCMGKWDAKAQQYKANPNDYVFKKEPKPTEDALLWCQNLVVDLEAQLGCELPFANGVSAAFDQCQEKLLRFYASLSADLALHERKAFTLLPQCGLRSRHVTFDAKLLERMTRNGQSMRKDYNMEQVIDRRAVRMHSARMKTAWTHIHSISTDGVSASVTFANHQVVDKANNKQQQKPKKKAKREKMEKHKAPLVGTIRLDELSELPLPPDQCRLFANDPGRVNVMAVIESTSPSDTSKNPFFRLTNKNIRHRSHAIKNRGKLERLKKAGAGEVHEAEQTISSCKGGTLSGFSKHVSSWSAALPVLSAFYTQPNVVRMKFTSHILRRRFLDRSMNQSFGTPKEHAAKPVVIAFGAAGFSSTSNFNPPSPNKKILHMLSKRYCVVLVDEFKTSKVCCHCGEELEPMLREIVDQDGRHRLRQIRGIKQCKTGCLITHGRDRNAAQNIMNILLHWLEHSQRPPAFSRTS